MLTRLLLAGIVFLVPQSSSLSQNDSLVGLKAVRLVVLLDREFSDLERTLQTRIEVRFRQSGLDIVDPLSKEREDYITIQSGNLDAGAKRAVNQTKLELSRWVRLRRADASELLTTGVVWKVDRLSHVEAENRAALQGKVEEVVDLFLNNYLKANPKR